MPEPTASDETLWKWALGGVSGFVAVMVAWLMRRQSIQDDREFEARKDFTGPLMELPAKLEALTDRVDRMERRLDDKKP